MKTINLNQIETSANIRRRYGRQTFTWVSAEYEGKDLGTFDPFPVINPSRAEVLQLALLRIVRSSSEQIGISEREFRQLYKGLKDGAKRYADAAEQLEKAGIELF